MTSFGRGSRRPALARLNLSTDPRRSMHRTDAQGRAAAGLVHRPLEAEALERFLDCGDLHKGFTLAYGEWLEDNVLPPVPHRQAAQ